MRVQPCKREKGDAKEQRNERHNPMPAKNRTDRTETSPTAA
jgi:hypothetical protein